MKRGIAFLASVLALLLTVGCGAQTAPEVDAAALAQALRQQVSFESELRELSASQLENYLVLPDGTEAYSYMSAGTTAEEILVAKCASEDDARTLKAAVESFLADQRQEMQRYLPEEAARLTHAVLAQKGVYVVLCVSADAQTAEQIIKEKLG
ncbi:MAG: DUF4358 domain-containing protein [Oscillospiraceae bacterium]|nr:DUF4358 domain-containing protein [Oscillospiraceae bacterium]